MIKAIIFDWGDTLMRDFKDFEGPMFAWPRIEVLEGVEEALSRLHGKYLLCVASNAGYSDAELMGKALKRGGIGGFFDHPFTSKELGFKKPDPAFFRRILEKIGVDAGECVFVGNDYGKDIGPAKSVGMKTVLISKNAVKDLAPNADAVIETMESLHDAILFLDRENFKKR